MLSNEILSNSLSDPYLPDEVQVLLRKKQRRLARENQGVLMAISNGTKQAMHECKHQFKSGRWNCSHSANNHKSQSLYGKIVSMRKCLVCQVSPVPDLKCFIYHEDRELLNWLSLALIYAEKPHLSNSRRFVVNRKMGSHGALNSKQTITLSAFRQGNILKFSFVRPFKRVRTPLCTSE